MDKFKIIIIDDHKIVREGLKSMLLDNPIMEVIGEGSNEQDLVDLLKIHSPTLVIMDISMPGKSGIELTEFLTTNYPEVKTLILTTNSDEDSIIASIEAGANGFLHKDSSLKELLSAIELVCGGEGYFSENITSIIYKSYITRIKKDKSKTEVPALTERELEIIKLFSDGFSFKEIAEKLCISPRTVESHKNNILDKLGLKNSVELVKYAIKQGIIKL
jgi:DNA-binding NarL/FixJ family response regulator